MRINNEASICTAELLAIEAGIEYIWESSREEFIIITDSLSSLQALRSQKFNNPNVSNMWHILSIAIDSVVNGIAYLSTSMTFCKVNGTWRSPASCLMYNQPFFTPLERRRDGVVLCRTRIDHAYFTNGYLLRGEFQYMCCNTRLTVRHIILMCAKYAHIRRK